MPAPSPYSADELMRTLYDELRKLARARIRRLPPGHTLQPTDLVHEVYVRLVKDRDSGWNGRAHFFGAAARAMRDILVDHARHRGARKRGGDRVRVDITVTLPEGQQTVSPEELLTLHRALETMQGEFPDHAELVLLHYFAGLTQDAIADVLGVSRSTVERRWKFARAWLQSYGE